MIRLEADGAELVAVIQALARAIRAEPGEAQAAPALLPAPLIPTANPVISDGPPPAPTTTAESFWNEAVPSSEPPKRDTRAERAQAGGVVFYHLVSTWAQNFGTEGTQPDRAKCLTDAMTDESLELFAFIHNAGGLTQAVTSVAPQMAPRQRRLIAENIASVSSALGITGLADMLEYTKQYRKMGSP